MYCYGLHNFIVYYFHILYISTSINILYILPHILLWEKQERLSGSKSGLAVNILRVRVSLRTSFCRAEMTACSQDQILLVKDTIQNIIQAIAQKEQAYLWLSLHVKPWCKIYFIDSKGDTTQASWGLRTVHYYIIQ